jgi:hypothetical protein
MRIESLYPANDVYQLIDEDNSVIYQGALSTCVMIKDLNE